MPSSHLIIWHPLLLPAIFPSIRDFSNESAVYIRLSNYWSFNFSISSSNEYSGLISLNIDWFDLQGTLWSLLQHYISKASILWRSAFFIVQLSQPYMITGKVTSLIIWTFLNRVMSLLFNTLSVFGIAFLPWSKLLLISWLQSVRSDFRPQEEEICHYSHPFYLPWSMGLDAMILCFFNI